MVVAGVVEGVAAADAELVVVEPEEEGIDDDFFAEDGGFDAGRFL